MKAKESTRFEVSEILKNAVGSIKLGMEDFLVSREGPSKSLRTLSAARNIYAGVLLLFKYKIASLAKTSEEARALIYVPDAILPHITDSGSIAWTPTPHARDTINTRMIEARLKSLGIYHDWSALIPLRNCRNALEHLHPTDPVSSIQSSIAALFPMLSRFIEEELGELPAALLGDAWSTMLATHDFFKACEIQISKEWTDLKYPIAGIQFMRTCRCKACDSSLLKPMQEDIMDSVPIDTTDFRLQCYSCGQTESAIQFLEENFSYVHEDLFTRNEIEEIQDCGRCFVHMYLIADSTCHWCGHERTWPKCDRCNKPISEHVTNAGGSLCDRCAEDEWRFERG